jgi:hypothetical protein
MPRRKLRPCPEGAGCKYIHEHQHTGEFSHGDASDKLAAKAAKTKATAWKSGQGQTLGRGGGGSRRLGVGDTVSAAAAGRGGGSASAGAAATTSRKRPLAAAAEAAARRAASVGWLQQSAGQQPLPVAPRQLAPRAQQRPPPQQHQTLEPNPATQLLSRAQNQRYSDTAVGSTSAPYSSGAGCAAIPRQMQPRPLPLPPDAREAMVALSWNCAECTLRNHPIASRCSVCSCPRPLQTASAPADTTMAEPTALLGRTAANFGLAAGPTRPGRVVIECGEVIELLSSDSD